MILFLNYLHAWEVKNNRLDTNNHLIESDVLELE